MVKDGIVQHSVNYISLRWTCSVCADRNYNEEISTCEVCLPRIYKQTDTMYGMDFKRKKKWSFYNCEDPVEEFVDWILKVFDNKFPVLIYSHNGGRYVVYIKSK